MHKITHDLPIHLYSKRYREKLLWMEEMGIELESCHRSRPDASGYKRMLKSLLEQMGREMRDVCGKKDREKVVNLLFERDGSCCVVCGKNLDGKIEIDHILPTSRRGTHTAENIRLVHQYCNRSRRLKIKSPWVTW